MTTLGLVINTYNEAHRIAQAIASAQGVDEIVVADMHSTDNTVDIAQSLGARILMLPNAGICEPGRQPAIDFATTDWVLLLDADERLSPNGVAKIRALIETTPPMQSAWNVQFRVFLGKYQLRSTGWNAHYERHVRLFRRTEIQWPGYVHAVPTFQHSMDLIPESHGIWIDHDNFDDLRDAVDNFNGYSNVIAREMLSRKETPSAVGGLQQGINEFVRRYDPDVDATASFAMAFAILFHRVLDHTKAIELQGWETDDLLPSQESMHEAFLAFWQKLGIKESQRLSAVVRESDSLDDATAAQLLGRLQDTYGPNAEIAHAAAVRFAAKGLLQEALDVIESGLQLDQSHRGLHETLRDIETTLSSPISPANSKT